jgi:glutaconate CoA-transferase, subunit A
MNGTEAGYSKLVSLAEAAAMVPDGAVLGVGGVMDQMVPTSFLLALAARGARDLHAVTIAAGLSIDLLVGAGAASEVSCAIVSFEDLGTSRLFRRRVEAGTLRFHEHSELTLLSRLEAAMKGLPFLPTRAALGTDILATEGLMQSADPFTGAPVVACAALAPDVSVVHAHAADAAGNVRLDGKHIWHDLVIAKAARRLIVTVEEVVPEAAIRAEPERTVLPAFAVDAVVEAPRGAWPTTCRPRYEADREALRAWVEAGADDAELGRLLATWIAEARR